MPRRLVAAASLLCVLATGACSPGTFVARDLPEQTIPGDAAAHAAAAAAGASTTIRVESTFAPIDSSIASRIVLESLSLAISQTAEPAGDRDCWDFVESVSVFVESTRQGSTQPRRLIATSSAPPGCVRSMDLAPVANVNLKPYTDEGFRVVAEATGVPPADAVSFVGHVLLHATVF